MRLFPFDANGNGFPAMGTNEACGIGLEKLRDVGTNGISHCLHFIIGGVSVDNLGHIHFAHPKFFGHHPLGVAVSFKGIFYVQHFDYGLKTPQR